MRKQQLYDLSETYEELPLLPDPEIYDLEPQAPAPVMNDFYPQWHQEARCAGMGNDLFFSPDDKPISGKKIEVTQRICAGCPVRSACLRFALESRERYGMWAGTTGRERARIQVMLASNKKTIEEVLEDYERGDIEQYSPNQGGESVRPEAQGEELLLHLS